MVCIMEPILTTILPIVATYLENKLLDSSLETLGSELSKEAIGWIKPFFSKKMIHQQKSWNV